MINKAIRLVSSDGYSSYTKLILVGFESEEQIQEAVQYIKVGTGTKFSLYRELVKMDERRKQGSKQCVILSNQL